MTYTNQELERLFAETKLALLEAGGVNNWSWYSESISQFMENNEIEDSDELDDEDVLLALDVGGVDNWEWYSESLRYFNEWEDYVRDMNSDGKDFLGYYDYEEQMEKEEQEERVEKKKQEEIIEKEKEKQEHIEFLNRLEMDNPVAINVLNLFSDKKDVEFLEQLKDFTEVLISASRISSNQEHFQNAKKKVLNGDTSAKNFLFNLKNETYKLFILHEFDTIIVGALKEAKVSEDKIISVLSASEFVNGLVDSLHDFLSSINELGNLTLNTSRKNIKIHWDFKDLVDNDLKVEPNKFASKTLKDLGISATNKKGTKDFIASIKKLDMDSLSKEKIKESVLKSLMP